MSRRRPAPPPAARAAEDFFRRALPVAAALFAGAIALSQLHLGIDSNDEGITAMAARRLLAGQLPYRDFSAVETPFSFYALAGAFKLAGATIDAGRWLAQLVGAGILWTLWRLSRRAAGGGVIAALPLVAMAMAGLAAWPFPSHHWWANLFTLAALAAADRVDAARPLRAAALAGLCAALAFWSLQDQGGVLVLALTALWLPALPRDGRGRAAAGWAGGLAAGTLPFLPLLAAAPRALYENLVRFPLTGYHAIAGNRPGPLFPLREIAASLDGPGFAAAPWRTTAAAGASLLLVLAPLAAAALLALGAKRGWGADGGVDGDADAVRWRRLLLAGLLAFALPALRRWAPINLMWAAPGPLLVIAWAFAKLGRAAAWPRRAAVAAGALFAVVGCARFAIATDPNRVVTTVAPAGEIAWGDLAHGRRHRELIEAIAREVPSGAPLVVVGWPDVNFYTAHDCPLADDYFVPGSVSPPERVAAAMRALDAAPAAWVAFPAFTGEGDEFQRYLLREYDLVWHSDEYGLARRRAPG